MRALRTVECWVILPEFILIPYRVGACPSGVRWGSGASGVTPKTFPGVVLGMLWDGRAPGIFIISFIIISPT